MEVGGWVQVSLGKKLENRPSVVHFNDGFKKKGYVSG